MDMAAKFQDQTVFHMTGKRSGDGLAALQAGFRPALLAAYRDLTRLRYDYPVVLLERDAGTDYVRSLSSIVGELIADIAPRGIEGERVRKHLLRLEREIRVLLAAGTAGTLTELWPLAAVKAAGRDDNVREILTRAARSLEVDGEVLNCEGDLAARFLRRAWRNVQSERSQQFRTLVDHLVRKLSDILRAAHVHSQAGQQPAALQSGFGALHSDIFDFSAMSRLVSRNVPQDELPALRRHRIEWALSILRSQPFYPDPKGAGAETVYEFAFSDCATAIEAHRTRLPKLVEVVKAIAVAELEARGGYVEAKHDAFFESYDEHALTADDLAQFPDYLVCIPPDRNAAPENAALLEMLSAGMPVKVLVQLTDLLEDAAIGQGHFAFGVRSARLATTAMGLGGMFVLQSTSSNLYALRERVRCGMGCRGPALFSVFTGSPDSASELSAYLTTAAAMKSRAFPAFTYDANAGSNWATRFSFENNRNPEDDWPVEDFEYADETLQRIQERVHFTYADFVLCDRRHAHHFAVVPRERWTTSMLPAADWLTLTEREAAERVPYVLAVDGSDQLHRVIVDSRLLQSTRRCLLLWHRLQEHGGIHNSHADQALAREKVTWEAQKQQEIEALKQAAPTAASTATTTAAPAATAESATAPPPAAIASEETAEVAAAPPSDEPWIETIRCSSCNECQNINDKLFAYNDNKQAYIKDVNAGTYRHMIEAAEACQVAIIHPGKPKNPKEPGLEELLERAKPFL
ncbi:MAG TPA: ferredoxin [Burkholderiaceae bacterium]|nr:ferredoxin [Burkholderiaceae bacterium]